MAGLGPEESAIDSAASLNDVSPTFALVAPSETTTIIPIYAAFSLIADGGALSQVDVAVTKKAADCAVTLVVTGTELNYQNTRTDLDGETGTATAFHTATATALTTADYITLEHTQILDAVLTTGAPMVNPEETVHKMRFWKDGQYLFLREGAALLFYAYTGSVDSTWKPYLVWAEVPTVEL